MTTVHYLGNDYGTATDWSTLLRRAAGDRSGPSWLRGDLDVASALADLAERFRGTPVERSIAEAALEIIEHGTSEQRAAVWQLPWELAPEAPERLLRLIAADRARLDEVRGAANVIWRMTRAYPSEPSVLAALRREVAAGSTDPDLLRLLAEAEA
jgi:hypothetical protein